MFYSGHNEQLVGKAVEPFRGQAMAATKFHLYIDEAVHNAALYEAVRRHLTASMKNLRTDYIDLYYLHRVNEMVLVEEVAEVMGKLITEGLIRGWGIAGVG